MTLAHSSRPCTWFTNGIVGIVALVCIAVLSGCSDSDTAGTSAPPLVPSGSLVDFTDCKSFGPGPMDDPPVTADCMFFRYDGVGSLNITHINAGFNCCPGELIAAVDITNNVITITEGESQSACRCLCLYDVEYEIVDLAPGIYTIRFVEIYTNEKDDVLEYTVDLTEEPTGLHCVERDHYPWDDGTGSGEPAGRLTGASGCNDFGATGAFDVTPPNEDCVDYHYNGNNILLLTHLNAGFNCCPVIGADIAIEENNITITEKEISGLCDCLCLFDLDYEIVNIPPGVYTIKVIEPHLMPGDELLEFVVDLTAEPAGTYCVERNRYPWGI
ncbi:MAG: hypothetical protein JSW50_10790 [Candidatus Latescibacterota bacterium]|nr:MAG: hypothetical protein JSW50_10790 [Candidatus Latescibacterota bacterium]